MKRIIPIWGLAWANDILQGNKPIPKRHVKSDPALFKELLDEEIDIRKNINSCNDSKQNK